MERNNLIKKGVVVAVIFLFIGLAFAPSISGTLPEKHTQNKSTIIRVYDFTDGNPHKAYKYTNFLSNGIFYLFPPSRHIRWEKEFDEYLEYPKLYYQDFDYAETSTSLFKKFVVHHFRFKLDADADSIDNLNVYWCGKATDDEQIKLFYWRYFSENKRFGFWVALERNQSQGSWKTFNVTIYKDNIEGSLNKDNIIDICLVAKASSMFSKCTLNTDYVSIISEEEPYDIGV